MFGKRKLEERNVNLLNRIKELEEILCPFQQHDFVEINSDSMSEMHSFFIDKFIIKTLMCKKCKKIIYRKERV